jgi:hypothetical protein
MLFVQKDAGHWWRADCRVLRPAGSDGGVHYPDYLPQKFVCRRHGAFVHTRDRNLKLEDLNVELVRVNS